MKNHIDFETYLDRLIKYKIAKRIGKQYAQFGLFGGRVIIMFAWSSKRRWRKSANDIK